MVDAMQYPRDAEAASKCGGPFKVVVTKTGQEFRFNNAWDMYWFGADLNAAEGRRIEYWLTDARLLRKGLAEVLRRYNREHLHRIQSDRAMKHLARKS